jgi:hypothetical protein
MPSASLGIPEQRRSVVTKERRSFRRNRRGRDGARQEPAECVARCRRPNPIDDLGSLGVRTRMQEAACTKQADTMIRYRNGKRSSPGGPARACSVPMQLGALHAPTMLSQLRTKGCVWRSSLERATETVADETLL